MTAPSADEVWTWLAAVPDPEIPVVSVVDLGIVRRVHWNGDAASAPELHVAITPTYSGCPATAVIGRDIVSALHERGVANVKLDVELAPAWTSAAISAAGHAKLRAFGIAPPESERDVRCPRCGSAAVEQTSAFGSTPCKALYRCLTCREPFDRFKCH